MKIKNKRVTHLIQQMVDQSTKHPRNGTRGGLTVKRIDRLNAKGRYSDGHGLYLQVNENGVKSWLLRYERNGKETYMGLGPLHTIDLTKARARAAAAREQLLDGIDPLEARRAAKAAQAEAAKQVKTFKQAATDYFAQHAEDWGNRKHREQFTSSMEDYAYPLIGNMSVAAIGTPEILKVMEQPVAARLGYAAGQLWSVRRTTADRVRGRIEKILAWATVRGFRTGDNPARWTGHLKETLPSKRNGHDAHHAAMPYRELPKFLAALRTRDGVAARALEFLILTAARTGEVTGATWDEIDFKTATWIIPAGRMKGGKEHRVPLSDRAIATLRSVPTEDGNPHIFIAPRSARLSATAMAAVLVRMGHREDATVHGFRSSFRDWCAEETKHANIVVEMALAHSIGDKVEAAYRRGDLLLKRRALMTEWARYCTAPPAGGKVLPMKKRRSA